MFYLPLLHEFSHILTQAESNCHTPSSNGNPPSPGQSYHFDHNTISSDNQKNKEQSCSDKIGSCHCTCPVKDLLTVRYLDFFSLEREFVRLPKEVQKPLLLSSSLFRPPRI